MHAHLPLKLFNKKYFFIENYFILAIYRLNESINKNNNSEIFDFFYYLIAMNLSW